MSTLEKRGSLFILTLTGAGEHRLSPKLIDDLQSSLSQIRSQVLANPRGGYALLTTADGKFFSNGFDLSWSLAANSPSESRRRLEFMVSKLESLVSDFLSLPLPTVAALNGHAAAAGFVLALSHDYVLMRKDRGIIYMSELDLGIPFPGYFLALLRAKIRDAAALRDVVLRAKKVGGSEAAERRMVDVALESYEEVLREGTRMGEEMAGRKWDGRIYASIRMGVFREVCDAVGLEVEDGQEVMRRISAKL